MRGLPADEDHIIAHMSGGKKINVQVPSGTDSTSMLQRPPKCSMRNHEVTREQRSKAKAVNFGIAYRRTGFGLAQNLGIPRAEAKAIIDDYFTQFPEFVGTSMRSSASAERMDM